MSAGAADRPALVAAGIAYFAIVAAIGTWAARRTRTERDFFVAGQGIGLWTLAIAAMASTLSGFAFIGGPGLLYASGFGAVLIVLSASLTGAISAWALGTRLRLLGEARGLLTIPAALAARYDSRAAQGLAATAILVAAVGYVATNLLALGVVLDRLFATGLGPGIWIGAAVTVAYSAAGGILAGVYTDVFQGSLKALVSVLVAWYAVRAGGGVAELSRTVLAQAPGWYGPWGTLPPMTALSFFLVFGVGALGQPHVLHKFYMVKEPRTLRWFPLVNTAAMALSLLLYVAVGVAVRALVARGAMPPLARPDDATPALLLQVVPPALAGIVFSGVAAAIMAAVNAFLSVAAAALAHDLPAALGRPPADALARGRGWTVALTVVAALVAQGADTLLAYLGIFGFGLFAAALVPALAIGLNWSGATRAGAVASIATGLGATLVLETLQFLKVFRLPPGVPVSGVALVASTLVFLGVSLADRRGAAAPIADDVRAVMAA